MLSLHCCSSFFSSGGEQGLFSSGHAWAYCGGFSGCRAQAPGHSGFSSWGMQALEHRLNSCGALTQLLRSMWDLSGSRIEPMSFALAGGFFTN